MFWACSTQGGGRASVKEDAAIVSQEKGEATACGNEERAADRGGAVKHGGRHLEAQAGIKVAVAARATLPSALLLWCVLHTLPASVPRDELCSTQNPADDWTTIRI